MNKTNKRLNMLILTISFIICLSMLTACGSTDGNQAQETSLLDSNETEVDETYEEPDSLKNDDITIESDEAEEHPYTYFDEVRATINMDRNEILSMLTDVIEEAEDGSEKENATKQKLKINEYMEKEVEMESLIIDKGYSDALVIMTDTSVNVTVHKQDLTQTDVVKICDVVMRETGRPEDQIVIESM